MPLLNDTQTEDELTLANIEPYVPGQTQKSPEYVAPEIYSPTTEGTVQGQITGILAEDSPYIQAARKRGEQYAQGRGLLNSSIAASASEKSAIEAALPIAQQDASTVSTAGLQKQKFEESGALTDIQAGASSQLAAQEQAGANYRQDKEIAFKEKLSLSDVALSEKNSIASQMGTLGDNFQAKMAGIQVDPGLGPTEKTAAIRTLQKAYEANMQSIGSIYGVQINWDTGSELTSELEEQEQTVATQAEKAAAAAAAEKAADYQQFLREVQYSRDNSDSPIGGW